MSKARRGAALPVFAPVPVAQEDVITAAPVKSLDRDAYVAEVRMRTAPRMQRLHQPFGSSGSFRAWRADAKEDRR